MLGKTQTFVASKPHILNLSTKPGFSQHSTAETGMKSSYIQIYDSVGKHHQNKDYFHSHRESNRKYFDWARRVAGGLKKIFLSL